MKTPRLSALVAGAFLSATVAGNEAMMQRGFVSPNRTFVRNGFPIVTTRHNVFVNQNVIINRSFVPFHRSSFFFFASYYPVYYPHYCYYDYYPTYSTSSYDYSSGNAYSRGYDSRSYYQLGRDWGQDLRRDIVTWDQFVAYLKAYIGNAPPTPRDEFRRGFLASYGDNGEAAFDKAMKQIAEQRPPNDNAGPSPPLSGSNRTY